MVVEHHQMVQPSLCYGYDLIHFRALKDRSEVALVVRRMSNSWKRCHTLLISWLCGTERVVKASLRDRNVGYEPLYFDSYSSRTVRSLAERLVASKSSLKREHTSSSSPARGDPSQDLNSRCQQLQMFCIPAG